MDSQAILKIVRTDKPEREISIFERRRFPLWLENSGSRDIVVDQLSLTFQAPPGFGVLEADRSLQWPCYGKRIPANSRECIGNAITPNLLFRTNSNVFVVTAHIRILNPGSESEESVVRAVGDDYIVVRPADVVEEEQVFVSFKDPEDLSLAELARDILSVAGYKPYLAREDHTTGIRYWEEKIYPAIDRSIGTLVIWTSATVQQPRDVLKEVRYSQGVHVPVGLFREKGASLPEEYPKEEREYLGFSRGAPWVPFAKAIEAAAARRRSGQPFFSE